MKDLRASACIVLLTFFILPWASDTLGMIGDGEIEVTRQGDVDNSTIDAFKNLGGEYGAWIPKVGFHPGRPDASSIPAFRFTQLPKNKLPEVAMPFVLDLEHVRVLPDELRELAVSRNVALHG